MTSIPMLFAASTFDVFVQTFFKALALGSLYLCHAFVGVCQLSYQTRKRLPAFVGVYDPSTRCTVTVT